MFLEQIRADWSTTSAYFACLLVAMFVDIVLGMLAAYQRKQLDSSVGRFGVIKKVAIILLVLMVAVFDGLFPTWVIDLKFVKIAVPIAALACIWFLVAHEWLSLNEKAKVLKLPLPKKLSDAMNRVKEVMDEEQKDTP